MDQVCLGEMGVGNILQNMTVSSTFTSGICTVRVRSSNNHNGFPVVGAGGHSMGCVGLREGGGAPYVIIARFSRSFSCPAIYTVRVLSSNNHNGFPVVGAGGHVVGIVERRQLLVLLEERVWKTSSWALSAKTRLRFILCQVEPCIYISIFICKYTYLYVYAYIYICIYIYI